MTINSCDYRCAACGMSITIRVGVCEACIEARGGADVCDDDCADECAYLYGSRPRPCADCVCFDADDEDQP